VRPRTWIDRTRPAEPLDLCRAIAVLRAAKGLSQKDLAQAAGMAPSTISDYERGWKVPSRNAQIRIFEALGQSVDLLEELVDLVRRIREGDAYFSGPPAQSRNERHESLGGFFSLGWEDVLSLLGRQPPDDGS
jgi:transcriptional regulator with XRE-family HTH domain